MSTYAVQPDGHGNYVITGTPAPPALLNALGIVPADGEATVLINKQVVDHYRSPRSHRLWAQAMRDRADLRRRLRAAERLLAELKGQQDMPNVDNVQWRRSTIDPADATAAVEVAFTQDGRVLVRNGDHTIPVLEFSPEAWTAFLEGVDNSEFDVEVEDNDE